MIREKLLIYIRVEDIEVSCSPWERIHRCEVIGDLRIANANIGVPLLSIIVKARAAKSGWPMQETLPASAVGSTGLILLLSLVFRRVGAAVGRVCWCWL